MLYRAFTGALQRAPLQQANLSAGPVGKASGPVAEVPVDAQPPAPDSPKANRVDEIVVSERELGVYSFFFTLLDAYTLGLCSLMSWRSGLCKI